MLNSSLLFDLCHKYFDLFLLHVALAIQGFETAFLQSCGSSLSPKVAHFKNPISIEMDEAGGNKRRNTQTHSHMNTHLYTYIHTPMHSQC